MTSRAKTLLQICIIAGNLKTYTILRALLKDGSERTIQWIWSVGITFMVWKFMPAIHRKVFEATSEVLVDAGITQESVLERLMPGLVPR